MRIDLRESVSCDLDQAIARFASVYFNDKKVSNCVMVDDVIGTVVLYVADENGRLVIDDDGESIKQAQYFGQVKIEFSPNAPSHLIEELRARA